jgi:hypothetical protein
VSPRAYVVTTCRFLCGYAAGSSRISSQTACFCFHKVAARAATYKHIFHLGRSRYRLLLLRTLKQAFFETPD